PGAVRRVAGELSDERGIALATRSTAFRIEIARVEEVIDPDHRQAEHMPRVFQDDPEAVQFGLLAVRDRLAGPAAAHLEDLDRLRRHDPARGQVVNVTVAHDAARRLPSGIEDDFLERVLYEDATYPTHAHHDRLVKT